MSFLPIEPYLVELLRALAQEKCEIVIAGGLGIYLKRRWVAREMERAGRRGRFDPLPLPDARATEDIDAFLSLDVFALPMRASFRDVLAQLGYIPRTNYYQFKKPMRSDPEAFVLLDLLAPLAAREGIKSSKPPRIGPSDNHVSHPNARLHAHVTPEAFAVSYSPQELLFVGPTPEGIEFSGVVRVPHPFASLCMKIKAAHDHERTPPELRAPRKRGEKHATDVYLLVAMLNEAEHEQTEAFVRRFWDHQEFVEIRQAVLALFQTPEHPGCLVIERNTRGPIDLANFSAAILELFAPEHTA